MGALATQKYSCVARTVAALLRVVGLDKDAIYWLVSERSSRVMKAIPLSHLLKILNLLSVTMLVGGIGQRTR